MKPRNFKQLLLSDLFSSAELREILRLKKFTDPQIFPKILAQKIIDPKLPSILDYLGSNYDSLTIAHSVDYILTTQPLNTVSNENLWGK